MFLVRKNVNHRNVYHIWIDGNTICSLYKNGGMVKSKHELIAEKPDLRICQMCSNVRSKLINHG